MSEVGPCESCGAGSALRCPHCGKEAETKLSLMYGSVCGACGKPRVSHERADVQTPEEVALLNEAHRKFIWAKALRPLSILAGLLVATPLAAIVLFLSTHDGANSWSGAWLLAYCLFWVTGAAMILAGNAVLKRSARVDNEGRDAVDRAQRIANDPGRVRVDIEPEAHLRVEAAQETLDDPRFRRSDLAVRPRHGHQTLHDVLLTRSHCSQAIPTP